MIEKHYTINDLTEILSMSFERTRQLVKDEPGVLSDSPRNPPEKANPNHVPHTRRRARPHLRRSANPSPAVIMGKGEYPVKLTAAGPSAPVAPFRGRVIPRAA